MTYNAGDRKHIRQQEKASKQAEASAGEVIRSLMSTITGRAWMYSRLESAHIFSASFSTDPNLTAFREGERNQGLMLLNDIMKHCPDQYVLMTREYNDRSSASERSRGEDINGRDSEPSDDATGRNASTRIDYPTGVGLDIDIDSTIY